MKEYIDKSAVIKGQYRYSLTRIWDHNKDMCTIIMLNPSIADAVEDDRTINNIVNLAVHNNFGGVEVVNLFAYRATDRNELDTNSNIAIGDENDNYIIEAAKRSKKIVLGWGNSAVELKNIKEHKRDKVVAELLNSKGYELFCAKLTKKGCPKHPLYISGETQFFKIKWDGVKFVKPE